MLNGMWIDLLKVLGTSVASIVALFLLAKLMGNKQISQLSMFDYIVGITIGSIAAEMATDLESPLRSLLAMVVYGLLAFFISVLTSKSLRARRVITGRPILLMSDGKIYRDNLKRARLDLTEFLALCRVSGYFDLSAISVAIMECSGTLSFLPVLHASARQSRRISVCTRGRSRCPTNVVFDGFVMRENLKAVGHDEAWLRAQLRERGFRSYRQLLLVTCDEQGNLTAYPMDARPPGAMERKGRSHPAPAFRRHAARKAAPPPSALSRPKNSCAAGEREPSGGAPFRTAVRPRHMRLSFILPAPS